MHCTAKRTHHQTSKEFTIGGISVRLVDHDTLGLRLSHTHTHTHTHIYIYIYIHTYIHIYIYTHTYIHTHTNLSTIPYRYGTYQYRRLTACYLLEESLFLPLERTANNRGLTVLLCDMWSLMAHGIQSGGPILLYIRKMHALGGAL
jgi:hypothetical protein